LRLLSLILILSIPCARSGLLVRIAIIMDLGSKPVQVQDSKRGATRMRIRGRKRGEDSPPF